MKKEFTVTKEHLILLKNSLIRWADCEFGAPAIDCKRPYGNSDVIQDIIKLLDFTVSVCPHCGEIIEEKEYKKINDQCNKLHKETEIVMDIILHFDGQVQPGTYIKISDYPSKWIEKKI